MGAGPTAIAGDALPGPRTFATVVIPGGLPVGRVIQLRINLTERGHEGRIPPSICRPIATLRPIRLRSSSALSDGAS
jgi:hypothetical protein